MASQVNDVNAATDVVAQAARRTPKRKKDPAAVARGVWGARRGPGTLCQRSAATTPEKP